MIQEIQYNGFTATPSDYGCADGQLALSIGVVPEDGALKPVLPPKILLQLNAGEKVMCIHTTALFSHYIIYNVSTGALTWADTDKETRHDIGVFEQVDSVNALGNVLVMVSDNPISYIYWKDDNYINLGERPSPIRVATYVNVSLQSSTEFESNEDEFYDFNDVVNLDKFKNVLAGHADEVFIDEENKPQLCNRIFALLNRMIAESQEKGAFNFPFFVRFAYRLFDGSRIMYTSPHLVIPSSTGKPLLLLNVVDEKIRPLFLLPEASLSFEFMPADEKWKDIITHIDILVTPQIIGYTADNDGIIGLGRINEERETYASGYATIDGSIHSYRPKLIDMLGSGFNDIAKVSIGYQATWQGYWDSGATYAWMNLKGEPSGSFEMFTYHASTGSAPQYMELPTINVSDAQKLGLPVNDGYKIYKVDKATVASTAGVQEGDPNTDVKVFREGSIGSDTVYYAKAKSEIDIDEYIAVKLARESADGVEMSFHDSIVGNNQFYLLESIEYEKVVGTGTLPISLNVDFGEGKLKNLAVKENVKDDYRSADKRIASVAHPYNNRLNLVVKNIIPFEGDSLDNVFDAPFFDNSGFNEVPDDINKTIGDVYFEIQENDTAFVTHVRNDTSFLGTFNLGFLTWIFYPNTNAKNVYLVDTAGGIHRISLKKHDFLNGSYAFNNFEPLAYKAEAVSEVPRGSDYVPTDKIYTSEVNNPFCFPVLGINTIGTGTILGISSAAKALSQGQFGQFPLYAFSTDGVWALEVSDTGTYSAKQPITRDVCINPDSITQIDSAVLFATDRGIMLISGSETACLSDGINSNDYFTIAELPKADILVELYNNRADKREQITLENATLMPFRDFLADCRMIYDYTNQRIVVYNSAANYAYVYSLKSKLWGMIHSDITDNVNSYPDALAMVSGNKLANYSLSDAEGITALIVTRPFKLGQPDVFKTIDTIIQRGYFRRGHVCQVLYGSRNLFDWHIVWSSTDKYLRGFRGTPYKYFRLALICKLDKTESIDGCTVQFTPRLTNKPR